MKKAALTAVFLVAVLAVVVAVLVGRTAAFSSRQPPAPPPAPATADVAVAADRLAHAVRFATVSPQDPAQFPADAFHGLTDYLARTFPRVHSTLTRETVNDYSLLYTWPGTDPSLPPAVLAAHLDVVPAEDARWRYPPFAGTVAEGYVWGRGALDDKSAALGVLESAERLLEQGFRPRRTLLFAFGHDEEVGGVRGAGPIVELLQARGVKPQFVLDEGGAVLDGVMAELPKPVAMIGIAEKGYLTLELAVAGEAGHSMRPAAETPIGILAGAVHRLEQRRFRPRLVAATRELFDWVGPEMPWSRRVVFANLWLFAPLVEQRLAESPTTDAAIRTTIAPTVFQAGDKENVLPSEARALINFRLLPGDSAAGVADAARRMVDDPRVAISVVGQPFEPSPTADTASPGFAVLARTVRQVFPEAVVAPYLVPGGTDGRYYARLTPNVYRFLPVRINNDELRRMHGVDERVSLENYGRLVAFYSALMQNAAR